ncbi:MAG: hypothetical protein JSV56_13420, partial [Methanomassiliicoccales archaeon]
MNKKRQLESILLVFTLVATSVVVFFPLTAPNVKAPPIVHKSNTADEDGVSPYDIDGLKNNIVVWNPNEDHHISDNYKVNAGYTLDIPAMGSKKITFTNNDTSIIVFGRFITHNDGNEWSRTFFWGENKYNWKGIYFMSGSEGCITDCWFQDAKTALVFLQNSRLISPGIEQTKFDCKDYCVRISEGDPSGYWNIESCTFDDLDDSAIGMKVIMTDINLKGCLFYRHKANKFNLYISNSNVYSYQNYFYGGGQTGNLVHIEDFYGGGWRGNSNGTIFEDCNFRYGASDDYLIKVDGATPLFDNCTFDTYHCDSVVANDKYGVPAHPIILNPKCITGSFDNTSINATGGSSVTLQWFMHVNARDPDDNPIPNAPVWVEDRNRDPAQPHCKYTDENAWAEWFIVTELILYNDSISHFSPFNVSAMNYSVWGFADPEPTMNMTKKVYVIVPFSSIPNQPPEITWVTTPKGVQSELVTIQY